MPNPKTRTVTNDLTDAIAELKKGRVEYRSDKTGVVNIAVGKVSMEPDKLADNINILISEIGKKKPSDSKADFVKSIHISSTMGPGVKIAVDGQQQEGGE
jgi:large subunit ribosomal protein L1